MKVVLLSYLFQFLPKLYHSIYLMKKLQKVTGFIFGSIWWRFNLNVFAYLIASHVSLYIILISSIPFFTIKLNYMPKLIHNDFLNFFIFFMIKMQTCLRIIGQAGHVVLSGQAVCFLLNTIITISKVDGLILHPTYQNIYLRNTYSFEHLFVIDHINMHQNDRL